MRMYWKYFRYVVKHKWFVFLECYKLGILWRGLVHDMSKFLPSEFIPYAKHFYGKGDGDFFLAVQWHYRRNKHHWQRWAWCVVPKKDGYIRAFQMPEAYVREMVADWIGFGRAHGKKDAVAWYLKNKDDMELHLRTRVRVRELLGLGRYASGGLVEKRVND